MPAASTTYWATPLQLDKASQPIPYWVLFVTIAVAILTVGAHPGNRWKRWSLKQKSPDDESGLCAFLKRVHPQRVPPRAGYSPPVAIMSVSLLHSAQPPVKTAKRPKPLASANSAKSCDRWQSPPSQ